MDDKMRTLQCLSAVLILASAATPSFASVYTPWGKISSIVGGGSADLRIVMSQSAANPDGCSSTDAYVMPVGANGGQIYTYAAFKAYAKNQSIRLTLDGCVNGRPRITSIDVQE
jgi:hypothetical protein